MTDETNSGHEALWLWFGLSYAGWLTLPRVLMHEMPDEWQANMAALLEEWNATWDTSGLPNTRVIAIGEDCRYTNFPRWLTNYRHPLREDIESVRAAEVWK